MKIIAYTVDRDVGIFNSLGERCVKPPFLEFLLQDYEEKPIRVFANLDADVANLCALAMNEQEQRKLSDTERLRIPPFNLRYFPNKFFGVDFGFGASQISATFSDISQYDDRFDKASEVHTPEACFERAKNAQVVAQEAYDIFVGLGCQPQSLISPSNVFIKSRFKDMRLPSVDDVPDEALDLAYKCAKGNWLECYTRGHFDKVWDYDLNSAYPYFAANLLDLRKGKWVHSSEYVPEAVYGYCQSEVSIDALFSPILYKVEKGERDSLTFAPRDVFETVITKAQWDFIDKHELGFCTPIDGWWWIPNGQQQITPLKGIINWLYAKKQASEGLENKIIKRIMAGSFYGIFLQVRGDDLGEYFLSPWGCEIETQCQLKIAETCLANKITPLHIAVDGFISTKPIPTPTPDAIGEWRLGYEGKALICGTGLVAVEGKIGEGDFSVSYDWLMEQINKSPKFESYNMTKRTVLTLHRAVYEKRLSELGKVITTERSVECLTEHKREYKSFPSCGGDLLAKTYQSKPHTARMIDIMTRNKVGDEEDNS